MEKENLSCCYKRTWKAI